MTKLDRPVVRETRTIDKSCGRPRPIVIRLEEGGNIVRLKRKGERRWYTLTYSAIMLLAYKAAAEEAKKQKQLRRQQRRAEKWRLHMEA
jgi:hypothetical protein